MCPSCSKTIHGSHGSWESPTSVPGHHVLRLLCVLRGPGHTGFKCLFCVTLDVSLSLTDLSPAVMGSFNYMSSEVPTALCLCCRRKSLHRAPRAQEGGLSIRPAASRIICEGLRHMPLWFDLQKPLTFGVSERIKIGNRFCLPHRVDSFHSSHGTLAPRAAAAMPAFLDVTINT